MSCKNMVDIPVIFLVGFQPNTMQRLTQPHPMSIGILGRAVSRVIDGQMRELGVVINAPLREGGV